MHLLRKHLRKLDWAGVRPYSPGVLRVEGASGVPLQSSQGERPGRRWDFSGPSEMDCLKEDWKEGMKMHCQNSTVLGTWLILTSLKSVPQHNFTEALAVAIFTVVSFIKQPREFLKNGGLNLCLPRDWELNHSLVNDTNSVCRPRTCPFSLYLNSSEQMALLNPACWQRVRVWEVRKNSLRN